MQDQASNYSRPSAASIFGEDGKLSSASAATSLKYARPQDLPSFPSSGGIQMSGAGAAASLASSNRKPFEHWKPAPIPAANKAAILAKDYAMDPLWQPEATKAGSKAAVTAHANPTEVEPLQPKRAATTKHNTPPSQAYDTPANTRSKALMAAQSVHNRQRSGSLPTQQAAKPKDDTSWALKAATKSHKAGTTAGPFAPGDPGFEASRIQNASKDNVNRQMYTSTPPVSIEVQEKNRQDMLKASAVAMARKMFAIQQQHLDEAAGKANSTRAPNRGRSSTVGGSSNSASEDFATNASGYENLEEAARKLAQERLAKIHDEHAEYRNYYGAQTSPPSRSRLSMRLRRRTSAGAGANDNDSDEEQSRKIRSQMSIFQSKLAEVDNKKRQQDRDALLVIAHRNVDAQISKMDEKVFQETGKASPAQMEKWQRAAREKAQRDSDERMVNTGKVHIGGGHYLDQSELDAIARARIQPTLDDIADKAEKQRARDEEERLDKLKKEQQIQAEKTRATLLAIEIKTANEKTKAEEKARKDAEKREQKEIYESDKQIRKETVAALRERERLEKEEQRKAKELLKGEKPEKSGRLTNLFSRGSGAATAGGATVAATSAAEPTSRRSSSDLSDSSNDTETEATAEATTFHDEVTVPQTTSETPASPVAAAASSTEPVAEPTTAGIQSSADKNIQDPRSSGDEEKDNTTSPTKNKSRVKSWMRGRFRSKSGTLKDGAVIPAVAEKESNDIKEENSEKDASRPDSMRDVAMAGRTSHESDDLYGPPRDISPAGSKGSREKDGKARSVSISSLSSHYSEDTKNRKSEEATIEQAKVVEIKPQVSSEPQESDADQRGRSGFKARLLKKITPNKTVPKDEKADKPVTPVVSNTTNEDYEEARDTFEEGKLSPPPPLSTLAGETERAGGQRTQSPKTSREQSRFTEDL